MSRPTKEQLAQWAAQLRIAKLMVDLEGGFMALANQELSGWRDFAQYYPGDFRVLSAWNSLGVPRLRQVTAQELTTWVLAGCRGWDERDRPPVVALGSFYQAFGAAVLMPSDASHTRPRLMTFPLITRREYGARDKDRIEHLLAFEPTAHVLCVKQSPS